MLATFHLLTQDIHFTTKSHGNYRTISFSYQNHNFNKNWALKSCTPLSQWDSEPPNRKKFEIHVLKSKRSSTYELSTIFSTNLTLNVESLLFRKTNRKINISWLFSFFQLQYFTYYRYQKFTLLLKGHHEWPRSSVLNQIAWLLKH